MSGSQNAGLPGQRGWQPTRLQLFASVGVVTAGIVCWINWPASEKIRTHQAEIEPQVYGKPPEMARPLPAPPPPLVAPVIAPELPKPTPTPSLQAPHATGGFSSFSAPKPERAKTVSYGTAASAAATTGAQAAVGDPAALTGAPGETKPTAVVYKPAVIPGGKAGAIRNVSLTLMPAIVQCTLINAIDSTVPGPVWCVTENDLMSPDNVILMERGTQIFGDYKQGPQQGAERIMVMSGWARTPNNIVVPLEGPMADGLGRAGIAGQVDNHYPERFGGAVLLALAGSAFQALANLGQSGNGNQSFNFSTGPVQNMASDALRATINIPPTLTANQGATVALYIRYPIDFSDVYKLKAIP
jgi:type IV secretion system protein VirB10